MNPVRSLLEVNPTGAPTQEQIMTAGLFAGAATLLLFFGLVRRGGNRRLELRLKAYVAGQPELASAEAAMAMVSSRRGRVNPLAAAAARITARLIPNRQVKRLRRKMIQAGHPSDRQLTFFLAAELTLGLLLGAGAYEVLQVTGYARSAMSVITIVIMFVIFGMYMPYMWLRAESSGASDS
jgi:hypothetical protein